MASARPVVEFISELDTPALLLDMGAAERNIARMAAAFADKPCRLRPHVKTHKLPLIARKQIDAGAIGVTCATLLEAEVMVDAGIGSVLIANEIVTASGIARVVEMSRRAEVLVCVDDPANARAISNAALASGAEVNVLVEVNVGLDRCGVAPGEPTLELARQLCAMDGLAFRGLMGYEGGLFLDDSEEKLSRCRASNELLVRTAHLLRDNGIGVDIVSAGGSNTCFLTGAFAGITDIQPGSYVTMDLHSRHFGLDFEQAVYVLATVTSCPEPGRAVIDAGLKAVSTDAGLPGLVDEDLSIFRLNEEHGHVRLDGDRDLSPGDKLRIIPSHGCTTIPLYGSYAITRGEIVESIEPVLARHGR